jgi:hypothetical protein
MGVFTTNEVATIASSTTNFFQITHLSYIKKKLHLLEIKVQKIENKKMI